MNTYSYCLEIFFFAIVVCQFFAMRLKNSNEIYIHVIKLIFNLTVNMKDSNQIRLCKNLILQLKD